MHDTQSPETVNKQGKVRPVSGPTQQCSTGQKPAAPRLYIFPHAGGSPDFYVPFSRAFSTEMKRIAVQYPGRRDRRDLPPVISIPTLADQICNMLTPFDESTGHIALFGHSMGALVAFEVALRLRSAGNPIAALFVSACAAPGRLGQKYFDERSDDDFFELAADLTGSNPEFFKDEKFVAAILPTVQSYRSIADYNPTGATISCPIYAFTGADDILATYDDVLPWSNRTTSEFAVRVFPGGHFYITEHVLDVAKEVETRFTHCLSYFDLKKSAR
jgi:surfactin synthase thioesterase subunit